MRVAVAGGTGLVGRYVVEELTAAGHHPVVLARSTGVDLVTGTGLDAALAGAEAVIDVSNVTTTSGKKAIAFFDRVAHTLLDAGEQAGVRHHVLLSIVGIDRVGLGYYQGKLRQEGRRRSGRPDHPRRVGQHGDAGGPGVVHSGGTRRLRPPRRLRHALHRDRRHRGPHPRRLPPTRLLRPSAHRRPAPRRQHRTGTPADRHRVPPGLPERRPRHPRHPARPRCRVTQRRRRQGPRGPAPGHRPGQGRPPRPRPHAQRIRVRARRGGRQRRPRHHRPHRRHHHRRPRPGHPRRADQRPVDGRQPGQTPRLDRLRNPLGAGSATRGASACACHCSCACAPYARGESLTGKTRVPGVPGRPALTT